MLSVIKDKFTIEKPKIDALVSGEKYNKAFQRLDKYQDIIGSASKKYNVDQKLIKSIILTESAGKPNAISHANAPYLNDFLRLWNPWNVPLL